MMLASPSGAYRLRTIAPWFGHGWRGRARGRASRRTNRHVRRAGFVLLALGLGWLASVTIAVPGSPAGPSIAPERPSAEGTSGSSTAAEAGDTPARGDATVDPLVTARRWIATQRANDRRGYANLLGEDFGAATARGTVDRATWLRIRWPQIATRSRFSATVTAIEPLRTDGREPGRPSAGEAFEVELDEAWIEPQARDGQAPDPTGEVTRVGRARLTIVDGRIVEEAHWH